MNSTLGPEGYLNHIRRAKKAVSVPIIASLNGTTVGGWTQYAKLIEQAGADALECNIYSIPTDPDLTSSCGRAAIPRHSQGGEVGGNNSRRGKAQPFFQQHGQHGEAARRSRREWAGAVQSLLSTRHQPRRVGNPTQRVAQHSAGAAASADLDRHPLRPHPCQPGCDQRRAWPRGRRQAADGRRRRHHALLHAVAERHQPSSVHRSRACWNGWKSTNTNRFSR